MDEALRQLMTDAMPVAYGISVGAIACEYALLRILGEPLIRIRTDSERIRRMKIRLRILQRIAL
jgi:hypothetical protein